MTTHLTWPIRLGADGQPVTVRQASIDDIVSQTALTASTPIGARAAVPAYGVTRQVGRRTIDAGLIADEISRWVPEAATVGATATIDADGTAHVTVTPRPRR